MTILPDIFPGGGIVPVYVFVTLKRRDYSEVCRVGGAPVIFNKSYQYIEVRKLTLAPKHLKHCKHQCFN